jgi:hypothetical protein
MEIRFERSEFVRTAELQTDLFDPEAIGYAARDPKAGLDTIDVPVYWLGREFAGQGSLPALEFDGIHRALGPEHYSVIIDYRLASDEFGPRFVSLTLYTQENWKAFLAQSRGGNWWDGPCVNRRDVQLEDRSVIFWAGPAGPGAEETSCPPAREFLAHVSIGGMVVKVDAPGVAGSDEYGESPYDTPGGIDLLVRSLRLRE